MGPESTSYREMESKDCNFNWLQLQLMHEGTELDQNMDPEVFTQNVNFYSIELETFYH